MYTCVCFSIRIHSTVCICVFMQWVIITLCIYANKLEESVSGIFMSEHSFCGIGSLLCICMWRFCDIGPLEFLCEDFVILGLWNFYVKILWYLGLAFACEDLWCWVSGICMWRFVVLVLWHLYVKICGVRYLALFLKIWGVGYVCLSRCSRISGGERSEGKRSRICFS